jgi:hypothetical protein
MKLTKILFAGVAICSTRQFFTKLAEEKDDDDDTGSN